MNDTFLKPKRRGRPSRCPDLETLNLLYTTKTTTEIAELMDVPRETVRGWIKRARRQSRRGKESGGGVTYGRQQEKRRARK